MKQTMQVESRPTITEFLLREQRKATAATGAFTAVINNIRLACKRIAHAVGQGALAGAVGSAGTQNVQGETPDAARRAGGRDLRAHQRVERHPRRPRVRGARGADPDPGGASARPLPPRVRPARRLLQHRRQRLGGQHLLGAALPRGRDRAARQGLPAARHAAGGRRLRHLRPDDDARAHAGQRHARLHARPEHGRVHPHAPGHDASPPRRGEFAINASNERFWEPPVRRYVAECMQGKSGPRGADFNMRWIASLVAEVHRILVRGGLFMYPRDTKDPAKPGRLRLLYEANPMAMLVEQAGGAASTGRGRILEVEPTSLHQRVPVILGSRDEVERIESLPPRPRRGHRAPVGAAPLRRALAVHEGLKGESTMSAKHPIIAITGSSGRRHHLGHAHLRADLPARERQRGLHRGRQLPPLRPRGDEGRRWRRRIAPATAPSATSAPRRTSSPSSRSCSATTARPAAASAASTCTTRARPRRTSSPRAPSPPGRTSRRTPTCSSTRACTARWPATASTSRSTRTCSSAWCR